MKTFDQLIKAGVASSLLLTAVAFAVLAGEAQAADELKGGQRLIELSRINTTEDLATLEKGDLVVMTCPKCKDTWVRNVDPEAKGGKALSSQGQPVQTVAKHLCPGCQSTIVRKGHGKQGVNEIVHVCQKCGSKEAYCCVLKKNSLPTKGMEKEKK